MRELVLLYGDGVSWSDDSRAFIVWLVMRVSGETVLRLSSHTAQQALLS